MNDSSHFYPGRFITLEGNEGTGKSTNARFIAEFLEQMGYQVILTREPGGERRAEEIRTLLLNSDPVKWTANAELLLIFAARAQHFERVILPALQRGDYVVCDRFTDATYAYQGGGRDVDFSRIAVLENWLQKGLEPDLTFWLRAPLTIARERVLKRNQPLDAFEQESDVFFVAVEEGYAKRFEQKPARLVCIDASADLKGVQADLQHHLAHFLAQWRNEKHEH